MKEVNSQNMISLVKLTFRIKRGMLFLRQIYSYKPHMMASVMANAILMILLALIVTVVHIINTSSILKDGQCCLKLLTIIWKMISGMLSALI